MPKKDERINIAGAEKGFYMQGLDGFKEQVPNAKTKIDKSLA